MADLYERHNEAMAKGRAVLLTAAGSGIGFALHETASWPLTASLHVAAGAIAAWSISFASGLFRSNAHESTIQAQILIEQGRSIKATPDQIKPFMERFDHRANAEVFWRRIQFWALLVGALIYFAGHALHLHELNAHRTSSAPQSGKGISE